MKIVVFGPERRLGALAADRVIDLNRGFARICNIEAIVIRTSKRQSSCRRSCDLSPERRVACVGGTDWSIRDSGSMDRAVSYNLQKNFDGAASMGPCIVVAANWTHRISTSKRGSTVRCVRVIILADDLVLRRGTGIPLAVLYLRAGNVIAGGTSAGTAADNLRTT